MWFTSFLNTWITINHYPSKVKTGKGEVLNNCILTVKVVTHKYRVIIATLWLSWSIAYLCGRPAGTTTAHELTSLTLYTMKANGCYWDRRQSDGLNIPLSFSGRKHFKANPLSKHLQLMDLCRIDELRLLGPSATWTKLFYFDITHRK